MKATFASASVCALFAVAPFAQAAEEHMQGMEEHMEQAASAPAHSAHGKVNSVDAAGGKVNITHDPIKSLKWPKMTMNFTADDPALLKDIQPGMTVDFEIRKMGNQYRITSIAPVQ
jgi:Cu/Ag efflux protein CusF